MARRNGRNRRFQPQPQPPPPAPGGAVQPMAAVPQPQGGGRYSEVGQSGLSIWRGRVTEEFLPELRGPQGRRIYQEMADNDSVIGGLLLAIKAAYRDSQPVVLPGGETTADQDAAAFLDSCLHDMSHTWADFISDICTMFTFGWAWFELVYKPRRGPNADPASQHDDGRIGWRKFAFRSQHSLDRWELDETGGLQGLWQRPPMTMQEIFLPIAKSLHFRTEHAGGSPEGRSIIRNAYVAWYYRKHLQELEGISLERMGGGIPVIKLPEGATDTDQSNAEAAIRRFKVDEQMGFVLPQGWELELAFGSGRNVGAAFETAITRYRQEMLLSALVQFLLLGLDKVGSYALSRTQRDIFQVALGGWLHAIEDVLNRFAVPRLLALNPFPSLTAIPRISLGQIGDRNLETFITALEKLVPLGLIDVSDEVKRHVAETLELPEPDSAATRTGPATQPSTEPTERQFQRQAPGACPECGLALNADGDCRVCDAVLFTPAQGQGEGKAARQRPFPGQRGRRYADGDSDVDADAPKGRDKLERQWRRSFIVYLDGQIGRVWDAVQGVGGVPVEPPDAFWDVERSQAHSVLLPLLVDTANAGARAALDAMETAYAISVDWSLVNTAAQDWARQYAGELDELLTDTTRNQVKASIANWIESGAPLPDLEAALREAGQSRRRAHVIASTEVTRAYAQGNIATWMASEVVKQQRWRTARDELVCPICVPKNNQVYTLGESAGTPPSHSRCRCWLVPVVGIPEG